METLVINTEALRMREVDFFKFCIQNRDLQIERDQNKNIILMAPTGGIAGKYNLSLAAKVWIWNEAKKLGVAFDSSAGFTLLNKAVRSPDVAWIEKARWENLPLNDRKKFPQICPDFVIELLSESDSWKMRKEKMSEWINNSCRLAWLIDIENKITLVYKPGYEIIEIPFSQTLNGEDVLPGFELNLNTIINT